MSPIHPVLLSGGAGTRLWPLSRAQYPKQLLALLGEKSLFQQTLDRVRSGAHFAAPLIVCNEAHRFLIAEQCRQENVAPQAFLLEPCGRNTAPAAAVAALHLEQVAPGALMLLLPSDHAITDPLAFQRAIEQGARAAQAGALVTFGIVPSGPETGYGYIKQGEQDPDGITAVERFIEKPDQPTAEAFLVEGGYFWNAGIFLFQAHRFLEELSLHAPEVLAACRRALGEAQTDRDFTRLDPAAFEACPSDSIDYAVMEKAENVAVVPVSMGWSDVGAWSALWELGERDDAGNVCQGDVVVQDSHDCYLRSDGELLAVLGLRDLVVVATQDAVLVADKGRVQDVKKIVDRLKAAGRREAVTHPRYYRPWGYFQTVDVGDRFQVKRLMVKPGERLSLQMHYHRAEHWVVVKGTARVIRDDETILVRENESVYIPIGSRHRLENPGKIDLHLVEVQSGPYLEEDDIIRFEDNYNRK